ncbi:MAG: hypothetical protein HYU97_06265 [Deltaproteobacteria bacterium]|nr:hypothetical protein [Deltaproteobacteria bacterium]
MTEFRAMTCFLLALILVWPGVAWGDDPAVACLGVKAVAQVDLEAKKKKLHFDLVIEAQAPDQIRFEMLDDFGQTLYQFEGDEKQFKKIFGFKLKRKEWVDLFLRQSSGNSMLLKLKRPKVQLHFYFQSWECDK